MNDFEIVVSLVSMAVVCGGTIFILVFNPFGLEKRLSTWMLGYDRNKYWNDIRQHGIVYAERQIGSHSILKDND